MIAPKQMNLHDVAALAYAYWRKSGYDHASAIAWLSMQDGETSMRYTPPPVPAGHSTFPIGDHGLAHDPFQHRAARIAEIKAKIGIDVADPQLTLENALKATDWETSAGGPKLYAGIRPALLAAKTMRDKVAELVHYFERSALQDRDIERRLHLATYWDPIFKG